MKRIALLVIVLATALSMWASVSANAETGKDKNVIGWCFAPRGEHSNDLLRMYCIEWSWDHRFCRRVQCGG